MRIFLGSAAMLMLSVGLMAADEAIDWKKLNTKWELVDPKDGHPMTLEFTPPPARDVIVLIGEPGKEIKVEGKYEIPDEKGNKLQVNLKFMNEDHRDTLTVLKLTGDELKTEDSKGKTEEFKKKK